MEEEFKNTTSETAVETTPVEVTNDAVAEGTPESGDAVRGKGAFKRGAPRKGGKKDGRPARPPREKPEFDVKTISMRRVTRVVSGGRRFSLSVAVVAGDRNGRIGLGTGKANDTQAAVEKASKAARKNMMTLKLNKNKSIPYDVTAKYKSATIMIAPNKGKGLIAGSSARIILNLAGVHDVTTKFHSGTKNKLNNARATMKALEALAYKRGSEPVKKVEISEEVKEDTK